MLKQKILAFQSHPSAVVGKLLIKLLRKPIKISFLGNEEVKIDDYVKTLGTQAFITSLLLDKKFLGTIYFSEELMFYFIDRMMGGTRAPYIKKYSDGLSKIDLSNFNC
jgi:flagellar motor switch protein FliM